MQAIDLLLRRNSARTLTEPAPDAAALECMFESAVHAPDHGHLRPWRFVVIDTAARGAFGDVLAAHLHRKHAALSEETLQRERQKAFRAPMIVVVAAHVAAAVKIPAIEQFLAAGAAAHALLLAAVALGFNGVWKTGDAAYDDTVKSALGFGAEDAIIGFLYLGTEAPAATPPPERAWRDLVRHWQPGA
jgi:nitroreductase